MWVGTNQGLAIFSNPDLIFNGKKNSFDARQIIIQVGSNYEVFLGKESINCIKIDPANRKWIGTRNGVILVSPDGYTVLKKFTTSNSPLLSNNVVEIGIDESNGEVFFGTDKGIISYTADATAGAGNFSNVKIYPNPVKPDYESDITIQGLKQNAVVKITDISGNLVFETTANGGTATWNGRNFNGHRVATGVYLILAADEVGSESYAGKILFIH
jgi:flagellar hook assembly protein FlgD